jgi:hypothetical protein
MGQDLRSWLAPAGCFGFFAGRRTMLRRVSQIPTPIAELSQPR